MTLQAFSTVVLALCAAVALLAHLLQKCRSDKCARPKPRPRRKRTK